RVDEEPEAVRPSRLPIGDHLMARAAHRPDVVRVRDRPAPCPGQRLMRISREVRAPRHLAHAGTGAAVLRFEHPPTFTGLPLPLDRYRPQRGTTLRRGAALERRVPLQGLAAAQRRPLHPSTPSGTVGSVTVQPMATVIRYARTYG